tara:strand:- start:82 stop:342 length:261 start_codon:yes stop_codon:yes gene_type:complete
MDIHLCVERLGIVGNSYTLTSSVPPHSIAEWRGPDPRPTEEELAEVWAIIAAEDAPPTYDELFASAKTKMVDLGFTEDELLRVFNI